MQIIGIDPGPVESGYCIIDPSDEWLLTVEKCGVAANVVILEMLVCEAMSTDLAIEMIASYGMPVGSEVFETCVWIGRFIQQFIPYQKDIVHRYTRIDIKNHFCHSSRAKDAHIRRALMDRFGGDASIKKGGALHGVKSHAWPALAVAVRHADELRKGVANREDKEH